MGWFGAGTYRGARRLTSMIHAAKSTSAAGQAASSRKRSQAFSPIITIGAHVLLTKYGST
jgi:hypothetical protein